MSPHKQRRKTKVWRKLENVRLERALTCNKVFVTFGKQKEEKEEKTLVREDYREKNFLVIC